VDTLSSRNINSKETKFNLPISVITLKSGDERETGNDTVIQSLELVVNTQSGSIVGRAKSRKDDLAVANNVKV
jgi:hypothetical protein